MYRVNVLTLTNPRPLTVSLDPSDTWMKVWEHVRDQTGYQICYPRYYFNGHRVHQVDPGVYDRQVQRGLADDLPVSRFGNLCCSIDPIVSRCNRLPNSRRNSSAAVTDPAPATSSADATLPDTPTPNLNQMPSAPPK